jgi:phosphoserine aminotransferase
MGTTYVRCKVLPGLFDGELYVIINGSSSAYVTQTNVKANGIPKHGFEVDGEVFAYIISKRDDQSLIELSGEAVVGGLRTWVPNTLLAFA